MQYISLSLSRLITIICAINYVLSSADDVDDNSQARQFESTTSRDALTVPSYINLGAGSSGWGADCLCVGVNEFLVIKYWPLRAKIETLSSILPRKENKLPTPIKRFHPFSLAATEVLYCTIGILLSADQSHIRGSL